MASTRLLCQSCKKLLEPEDLNGPQANGRCPACGSSDIRKLKTIPPADETNGGKKR